MKIFIKNLLIIATLILLFIKRPLVINGALNALNIWTKNIFPSIFPIMVLSDLIISSNIIIYISNIIGPLFKKLFKINKYSSYPIIMSMVSGSPTNAKYIKDLLNNKNISLKEAEKILSMSLFYNPLLILNITTYLNINDRIYLVITNIIANIIIGLINRNYNCDYQVASIKPSSFSLNNSINNAISILLNILGIITIFSILNAIIPFKHPLIAGVLEITSGLNEMNRIITYKYKLIFTSLLMGFGGLSIISQIKSIFKDTCIDYSLFYKSRIIHIFLMLLFSYIRLYCH